MAFKLAEAFVELKARGEKELHKSLEKTKGKVEEIGPATEQAEKRIEKAFGDAAKGVEKSADKMADALQKPIDKLAEFEKEMKAEFAALQNRAEKLKVSMRGGPQSGNLATLGPTNAMFGRFGGAANVAAGGALVGIGTAVAARANELQTSGKDSEVLGPQVSSTVREVVGGLREFGAAVKDVGVGFVDGLLGLTAILGNMATFGGLAAWGRSAAAEEARVKRIAEGDRLAAERRATVAGIDAEGPIRNMERQREMDALFRRRGIRGLEEAAAESRLDLQNRGAPADAERLRDLNARIASEKERAAKAGEASAEAAEREARAIRDAMNATTFGPQRQLEVLREAWQSGKPLEVVEAERKFGLSPQTSALMESRIRGRDTMLQAGKDAGALDAANKRMSDRVQALIDEGNEVRKLQREYEEFAAIVAGLPEGAGKVAAQAKLAELRLNVDAAGALMTQRIQDRERQQAAAETARAAGDKRIDAIRRKFDDEQFAAGNKPRDTAQFRVVDIADLARQLQSDIFAKEDEQLRVEEEKKMHEEAQKKRDEMVQAINAVKEEVKNQVAKFN